MCTIQSCTIQTMFEYVGKTEWIRRHEGQAAGGEGGPEETGNCFAWHCEWTCTAAFWAGGNIIQLACIVFISLNSTNILWRQYKFDVCEQHFCLFQCKLCSKDTFIIVHAICRSNCSQTWSTWIKCILITNKFYWFRPSTTGLLSTRRHSCNAYLVTNCAEPTLKQKVVRVGVEAHAFVLLNSCVNYRIW